MTEVSANIETIIAAREPLSTRAKKIYETISGAGGFLETYNITFSRAIGIKSTGQDEFLKYLDECIEKDYVRVIFKENNKKKNGFFTLEYFYQVVLARLLEQNYEAYQFQTEYIANKAQAIRLERGLH